MSESEFLNFLGDVLIAERPLHMDEAIPAELFDSTGKLLIVTAFEKEFGTHINVESILTCTTPRDLYTFVGK